MTKKTMFTLMAALTLVVCAVIISAVTVPNNFTSGSSISASQMNANFTTLANAFGNLNTGYAPYWNGSAFANSGVYWDSANGRVGIGTTSPDQKLSLNAASGVNRVISFRENDSTVGYVGVGTDNILRVQAVGNRDISFNTNSNERLYINGSGNVGIGTTTPGTRTKLAISGGVLTIGSNAFTADASLVIGGSLGIEDRLTQICAVGATKPALNLMSSTNASAVDQFWAWGVTSGNVWRIQDGTAFSGGEGLSINSSGYVGIGIETSFAPLAVRVGADRNLMVSNNGSTEIAAVNDANSAYATLNFRSSAFAFYNGNVGIGRTPTTNILEIEGNASKTTAGDWLANSDRAIKENITDITGAIDTIMQLHPVKFKYTEEYKKQHPSVQNIYYYNYVAQEYRTVFPDSVMMTDEGVLAMDGHNANIVAVKAIQEQHGIIETLMKKYLTLESENGLLKAANKEMKTKNAELEARLAAIEEKLGIK